LIGQSKITSGNYLMSIYLFEEGYFKSDFGRGAAISILMLLDGRDLERRLRAQDGTDRGRAVSKQRRGRRAAADRWNAVGLAIFVVMVFRSSG